MSAATAFVIYRRKRFSPKETTPEDEIATPGAMVAPTRLLGPPVIPGEGQAGPLVAINGEMGAVYLLTMDGLFVQTLGGDARQLPPLSEQNPKRHGDVKDITFQQEHFHPTINQTADGNLYLIAGFQQSMLLNLTGWESVHRRDFGKVTIGTNDLAGIPATFIQPSRSDERPEYDVAILKQGPKVDGDLSDWPAETRWLAIDNRAAAAICVDGGNLNVALRTDDTDALENAGRDYRYLFKSGGALDLMLGTNPESPRDRARPVAGDVRVVATFTKVQPAVTLYRAVAVDAAQTDRVAFESPIGKLVFGQVRSISQDIQLAQIKGNFEFSVPLKQIGLEPGVGVEIVADVGVLRGFEGRTVQRTYWSNKRTALVSDLPSEARFHPDRWGVWRFKP